MTILEIKMKEYLSLQYKMTNRRFKDIGFEPLVAYFLFAVAFVALSIYLFDKTQFAEYIYMLFAIALIGSLSETRRIEFLKICFGNRKLKRMRIAENLICSIPFVVFLLCKQLFLSSALLLALISILALINFRATSNFTIWTPFSKKPFEFTIGFRNTFYLIVAAYTLSVIAISVNNFNLGAFSMLLVFASALSYYTRPENEYYVWIYRLNVRQFLLSKIKTAISFSSLLALPIAIALAVFFPQHISLLLLFFLIGCAFLVGMIVSKYAAYPEEINITQGILLVICIGLPPMLVILIPYLFLKSENSLRRLLK